MWHGIKPSFYVRSDTKWNSLWREKKKHKNWTKLSVTWTF